MKTSILALAIILFTGFAQAELTISPKSKIKRLISYADFGNGDVYVELESKVAGCPSGYYVNRDDKGFNNNFSMLLAAYQAQSSIYIYAYDSTKWAGSSAQVCKIYSVMYK